MNCNSRCHAGFWQSRWRLMWLVAFVLCQMPGVAALAETRREPGSMEAGKSKTPPEAKSAKPKSASKPPGPTAPVSPPVVAPPTIAPPPVAPTAVSPSTVDGPPPVGPTPVSPPSVSPPSVSPTVATEPSAPQASPENADPAPAAGPNAVPDFKDRYGWRPGDAKAIELKSPATDAQVPSAPTVAGPDAPPAAPQPPEAAGPPKVLDKAVEPAAPAASSAPAMVQPADRYLDPFPYATPAEAGAPEPQPPTNQEAGSQPAKAVTIPSTCNSADFRVTIDVGHTVKNYGAMSARNKPEFAFNLRLANELLAKLQGAGFVKAEVVVQPDSDLSKRANDLNRRRPDLMLSLHHDSVQDKFLTTGELDGVKGVPRSYSIHPDAIGYSIFISRDNPRLEESKQFALLIGQELRKRDLKPTMHHNEPISGENRPIFDAKAGVFYYDLLVVLRQTTAPAVLLESAVITDPLDELNAEDPVYRAKITDAILAAVGQYCGATGAAPSGTATPRKKK
jgi:N-acetylmuramoyl-L-alanine amidase